MATQTDLNNISTAINSALSVALTGGKPSDIVLVAPPAPILLNYTGLSGTPTNYNTLGRVKVFNNLHGPYVDPEDPELGFQWADVVWKRCDSTSTYNDENYTDVRHNYSVGDLISFVGASVYNGLTYITKPITEVTDTTFTIRGVPADSVFAARPAVYNCTRLSTAPTATEVATAALTSYIQRCGNNVTDTKNLYTFIKGCVDLGIWNNMVCWPMRLGQNVATGNILYSLGGLSALSATITSNVIRTSEGLYSFGATPYTGAGVPKQILPNSPGFGVFMVFKAPAVAQTFYGAGFGGGWQFASVGYLSEGGDYTVRVTDFFTPFTTSSFIGSTQNPFLTAMGAVGYNITSELSGQAYVNNVFTPVSPGQPGGNGVGTNWSNIRKNVNWTQIAGFAQPATYNDSFKTGKTLYNAFSLFTNVTSDMPSIYNLYKNTLGLGLNLP